MFADSPTPLVVTLKPEPPLVMLTFIAERLSTCVIVPFAGNVDPAPAILTLSP